MSPEPVRYHQCPKCGTKWFCGMADTCFAPVTFLCFSCSQGKQPTASEKTASDKATAEVDLALQPRLL